MAGEGRKLIRSPDGSLRERSHGAINPAADDNPDLGPRTVKEELHVEGTSYYRIDTALDCCGFTQKYRNNRCFQIFTFAMVLAFDLADMLSDWLLFRDVAHVEKGLVFGPPEMSIVYALLFFSVVGTVTFSIEIVNVWLEIFYNQPLMDPELLTVCTMWIEDVPQIIINIFIAMCREDAISYYQVVKAVVIILGSFIRVLMGFIRLGDRQSDEELRDAKSGCRHLTYRILTVLGLFTLFFASVIVCFLTLFERTPEGSIKFDTPKDLFDEEYDSAKFFTNVSIYVHLPILEFDNTTYNTTPSWLRLTSIYDIKRKNGDTFKLSYDSNTYTKFVLWQSVENNRSILESKECFILDRHQKKLIKGPNNCTNFLADNVKNSLIIKFRLIPEKIPELIFGDINYNIRFQDKNGCHNVSQELVDDIREAVDETSHYLPTIHYYKVKENVSEKNHLVWDSPTNPRFFIRDADLIDITSVWKTGFAFCQSTGSLAPHRNFSIPVTC